MDVLKKLASLRPIPIEPGRLVSDDDMTLVERTLDIVFPDSLKAALAAYTGGIQFEAEVLFKPLKPSGWEGSEGELDLNVIYGVPDNDRGLISVNEMLAHQLPSNLVAIGESSGGNQVCIERQSGAITFWDHEARPDDESEFPVSDTFDSFVEHLYVGADDPIDTTGIRSTSFLDF